MVTREAKVINAYGIHCRPSAEIIKQVTAMDSSIEITANGATCSLGSIIELLSLGIKCGDVVSIKVEGSNEEADADAVVELFETNFDFKR